MQPATHGRGGQPASWAYNLGDLRSDTEADNQGMLLPLPVYVPVSVTVIRIALESGIKGNHEQPG